MTDIRMKRLADLLVNYGVEVQPGDWVNITGDTIALPMIRCVFEAVLRAGGHPTPNINDEYTRRAFLRDGSEDQLKWLNPTSLLFVTEGDKWVNLLATSNTRAMTHIDPLRVQQNASARQPLQQAVMQRTAAGELMWTMTQYPSEAVAQEANMSLEEYEDFLYASTFCDQDDPVERWQEISILQQEKVDWLKGKKTVRLHGPNIEMELSIEDRIFINADGKRNMPDGEIFTGPVEDSANGWVRFTYPSIVSGRAVSGIDLKFLDGKVVEAHAEENNDLLQAQLDTDEGSRYLGEFAIGTNFGIQQFTGNILFDEKIGGTIHMAVGAGYPDTGSKNVSAIHWDMICDMRNDSTIHVDEQLFYRNGAFVV